MLEIWFTWQGQLQINRGVAQTFLRRVPPLGSRLQADDLSPLQIPIKRASNRIVSVLSSAQAHFVKTLFSQAEPIANTVAGCGHAGSLRHQASQDQQNRYHMNRIIIMDIQLWWIIIECSSIYYDIQWNARIRETLCGVLLLTADIKLTIREWM